MKQIVGLVLILCCTQMVAHYANFYLMRTFCRQC